MRRGPLVSPRIQRLGVLALAALLSSYGDAREARADDYAPMLSNGNVIGHVVDEYQNPLAGLPVTMQDQTVYTDAQGNFTFNDAPVAVRPSSWGAIKTRYMDGTSGHMSQPSRFSPQSVSTSLDTLLINGGNANWSYRVPITMDGSEQVVNVMLPGDDISNQEYREMHELNLASEPNLQYHGGWSGQATAFPLKTQILLTNPLQANNVRQYMQEFDNAMGRDFFVEVPSYDETEGYPGGWVYEGSNTTPTTTYAQAGVPLPAEFVGADPMKTILFYQMELATVDAQTVYHELGRALGVRGAITGRQSVFDNNGYSTIVPADVSLMNLTYDMHAFDLNDGSTVEFEWKNLEQ